MALLNASRPPVVMRRLSFLLLLVFGLGRAAAQAPQEYQLKAVFLFNFAQFIEWPTEAFADAKAPLVVGVLGTDPFGARLDETVLNESVGGHPLEVRRFKDVKEIDTCHILFISRSENDRLGLILAALRGRNILTVGDTEGYALRGVMIRFLNDRNRIRLRINLNATRSAGLVVSSKLLRSAEIVTTKEN